jgi:hypothetical protein
MKPQLKLKTAAAACALAFAGAANAGPFDSPDVTVFLSGASAPQNYLGALATQLFQGALGTDFYAYYDDNGTAATFNSADGANYRAYFGRLKTTAQDPNMPASIANKLALIINRAKGGSIFGVNPVARDQAIQWMDVSSGNCTLNTTASSTTYQYACALTGADDGTGGAIKPDFGVSDVEPQMFKFGRNTEWDLANGQPFAELDPTELAALTVKGSAAVMFGAAATKNVTDVYPDIPAAMFGGLLNGSITTWNKVDPVFSSSDNVVVCRRFPGSGTQASYNQFFHNWPCSVNNVVQAGDLPEKRMYDSAGYGSGSLGAGDGSSAANAIGIDASAGFTVLENSSSGNVRTCLTNANAGTDYTFQDEAGLYHKVSFSGARKAVGVLSLDSKGNSGFGTGWNFLDLGGASPTQTNMISIKYPFIYEVSMQYNTAKFGTLSTGQQDLITYFIKRSGDPVVLAAISNTNVRDAFAAVPINYTVGSHAKVMKGTRNADSCKPIAPK